MAKKTKKATASAAPVNNPTPSTDFLSQKWQDILFPLLMTILLVFLFKPMVIDHLVPRGVDVLASTAINHQVNDWSKKTGEIALWNPDIFAGMPRYQRLSPVTFSIDSILSYLGRFFSSVFMFTLFAALGMYFFLRYLGLSPLISIAGTLAFILMPHYKSLYLEGHFAKYRALMFLPWVTWAFYYFIKKRNILSAALFALAFGLQIRTQHYQIVFYTGLFMFAIGIGPLVRDFLDKAYMRFSRTALLAIAAVALAILTAAQPIFQAKEYLPWSKRGKTTINLSNPQKMKDVPKTNGVSIKYATQWSTAPDEIFTWLVPHFYGGMSGEKYNGDAAPQARGQVIPGYWGHMPFTQSYEYMGALTFLLALIGFWYNRKNKSILAMTIFAGFLTLLSFGRHALWFYSLFYDYMPFFNKFRAPMMSVTVTFFIVAILAAYGLKALWDLRGADIKKQKPLLIILGGYLTLGLILWLAGQGFSFLKDGEAYNPQVTALLISIRREMFNSDMLRFIALALAGGAAIFAYLKQKLSFVGLALFFVLVGSIDLINIQSHVNKDFVNLKRLERNYFKETPTDAFLRKDKEVFRIMPFGRMFGDNRWVYFHQSIGGYTPIKMFTIEEIVENNLANGGRLNPTVLKLLDVKYVVSRKQIDIPGLKPVNEDKTYGLYTYLFTNRLKRAFFVGKWQKIEDEYKRVGMLNSPLFFPERVAITEKDIPDSIYTPDSVSVQQTAFSPNGSDYDVFTDKQALLVISELYYPPGWKISIDGQMVKNIYKTDHALMSVVVPAGRHKVTLRFEPDSYRSNVRLASVSLWIIYLSIAGALGLSYLRSKKQV